jgi:hypothetical protein
MRQTHSVFVSQSWSELNLLDWVRQIISNADLESSPKFAERVLSVVSRSLHSQSKTNQDILINLLKEKRCVPTKRGMKCPTDAYFPTVKLFEDLPIMILEHPRGISETMLLSLGVRKVYSPSQKLRVYAEMVLTIELSL